MEQNVIELIERDCHFLKMYSTYVSSFDDCLRKITKLRASKKFASFEQSARVRAGDGKGGLDLQSYLIMPVQRVPRSSLPPRSCHLPLEAQAGTFMRKYGHQQIFTAHR